MPAARDFVSCAGPHLPLRRDLRVILLGLQMPRLDASEILRRPHSEPCTTTRPVVMFTTSRDRGDVEPWYYPDASGYACKTVGFRRMVDLTGSLATYWSRINESVY